MPVTDPFEAKETYGKIRAYMRDAANVAPQNEAIHRDYYKLLLKQARQWGGGAGTFNQLSSHTNTRLNTYPDHQVARQFRGIARVHQLGSTSSQTEWRQARADLQRFLKQNPDDAEALYHLALGHLKRAAQADRPGGDQQQVDLAQKGIVA